MMALINALPLSFKYASWFHSPDVELITSFSNSNVPGDSDFFPYRCRNTDCLFFNYGFPYLHLTWQKHGSITTVSLPLKHVFFSTKVLNHVQLSVGYCSWYCSEIAGWTILILFFMYAHLSYTSGNMLSFHRTKVGFCSGFLPRNF